MKIDYPRLYVQFHPSYLEPPAYSKQFLFSFGSYIVATGDKSEKNSLLQSKTFTLCHDFCSNLMFHFHSTSLELNLIKKYIARIEKQQTPFSLVFGPLFSTRKASNIFRFPLKLRVIEVRLLIFSLLLSQIC